MDKCWAATPPTTESSVRDSEDFIDEGGDDEDENGGNCGKSFSPIKYALLTMKLLG